MEKKKEKKIYMATSREKCKWYFRERMTKAE